ncbi:hypothetical protein AB4090_13015 [Acidithiobacillus sp. IBUN Pt1247-S3]|uniref:hypothetical protein n=1 Tax=Acidithiobacillus sp. IBUN Pt1247-S3 TaxID=3166642 RepID=UPI0034E4A395
MDRCYTRKNQCPGSLLGRRSVTGVLLLAVALAIAGCSGSKQDNSGKSVNFQGKTEDGTRVQARIAADEKSGESIAATGVDGQIAFHLLQKTLEPVVGKLTLKMDVAVSGQNANLPSGEKAHQLVAYGQNPLPPDAETLVKTQFARVGFSDVSVMSMAESGGRMMMISGGTGQHIFDGAEITVSSIQVSIDKGRTTVNALISVMPKS